ncbi:MAG: ATP-binding cassette domain-containing protein [Actinobacteria bacterium]|nr:ATP-binding cassette domain-containing protein [Actinomycetota bacterium]
MISFRKVSLIYPNSKTTVFDDVTFEVSEGEFVLLIGATGMGKSSALKLMNGLVPHHTGGILGGDIQVSGISTRTVRPGELAHLIGIVGQNPIHGFVTDIVEEEIAFAMESLAIDESAMRKRVEEVLDLLALTPLRRRTIASLSGGEQQRVAIAAALVMNPRILLLDEPTSALDPVAAEEVLAILQRIVHDLGVTVVVAEHRLERVIHYAERVIYIASDGTVRVGSPEEVMRSAEIAPPIVELARALGWEEMPLSVRDARRISAKKVDISDPSTLATKNPAPIAESVATDENVVEVKKASPGYASRRVIKEITCTIAAGEIVALMGRNGSGKSTLLKSMAGLVEVISGALSGRELVELIGYVPQEPSDLLYGQSVEEECALADHDNGLQPGTTLNLARRLLPEINATTHPRDLSEGQRLILVLAIVLTTSPKLLILDEPTRGLDYQSKERLISILQERAAMGSSAVLLATHDVELVAELAQRVLFIADGELVSDGDVRDVLTASLPFAPQVTKIFAPSKWLTVGEVVDALQK